MRALRLLLVTDAVGGVWVYSLELAHALRPLGVETILAVVGPPLGSGQKEDASEFAIIETGLPLEWLETEPDAIIHAGEALAELAIEERVDLVQTSSASLLAGGTFGCACIAVQHSCVASWWEAVKAAALPHDFAWRRELVRRGLRRADAVIAPSIAFARETMRIYGVPTAAVPNGRSPFSSRELPRGEFVFTAGRLWDEGKNLATLDAAAEQLHVPFQAAGSLEGPNGSCTWLDHIDAVGSLEETRLARLYAARPIYASAALYEPFGLSVLEAAQAGCALVLSDIATHREIWGGTAIFVPPRDSSAFAGAIQDLLSNPDERERFGGLAAVRARQYSPERMARSMAEIYTRLAHPWSKPAQMVGAA